MHKGNFTKPPETHAPAEGQRHKPVAEIRIGTIKASIWARQFNEGTAHNVTFARIYKSGEEWRRAESYGRDDLLTLAKVVDMAHTWIIEQQCSRNNR